MLAGGFPTYGIHSPILTLRLETFYRRGRLSGKIITSYHCRYSGLQWDSAVLAPRFLSCYPPLWFWGWRGDGDED